MIFAIPSLTFILLWVLERILPTVAQGQPPQSWDKVLNGIGLFMQGCVVPGCGYLASQKILPLLLPHWQGSLSLGWWGAFLLNIIGVDFLYYWQHRAFHRYTHLWNLHKCHHASSRVDIWVTSRNSLLINFLFVYLLLNPILAFFCDVPMGFYTGAIFTASLDIFRHSSLDMVKILPRWIYAPVSQIMVMPCQHHHHHSLKGLGSNFGANFIIWDRLFGTVETLNSYPHQYGVVKKEHPIKQLLYPFVKK